MTARFQAGDKVQLFPHLNTSRERIPYGVTHLIQSQKYFTIKYVHTRPSGVVDYYFSFGGGQLYCREEHILRKKGETIRSQRDRLTDEDYLDVLLHKKEA